MRFGKTGAARLGIAFARRMVLPCQRSVRGRVRSVRGPAFLAPRQPADPNSDFLWLFVVALWSSICVVRHAESLARRLG